MSLSVRQKVRQFAVDTDLSVSLGFTCKPPATPISGLKPACNASSYKGLRAQFGTVDPKVEGSSPFGLAP